MEVVIDIDGREAIPVRALSFVTGWMMSPDLVAASLANTDLMGRLKSLSAFHLLPDGRYARMLPKEWDGVEADLKVLSDRLKASESFNQENYPDWRRQSIPMLPAGVFVWKDEFERAFAIAYSEERLTLMDERNGDRELNFMPRIPEELHDEVLAGFPVKVEEYPRTLLHPLLDGRYDDLLDSFTPEIRARIKRELFGTLWDNLTPAQRKSTVEQHDYQRDPATEAERKYFFDLWCQLDAVQRQIAEWASAATPTALDKVAQQDNLLVLRDKAAKLDARLKSPMANTDFPTVAPSPAPQKLRGRVDAMSAEIDAVMKVLGPAPAPHQVMHKLKSFAGMPGSCITESGSNFVIWQTPSGENHKLDLLNLRKRLERREKSQRR